MEILREKKDGRWRLSPKKYATQAERFFCPTLSQCVPTQLCVHTRVLECVCVHTQLCVYTQPCVCTHTHTMVCTSPSNRKERYSTRAYRIKKRSPQCPIASIRHSDTPRCPTSPYSRGCAIYLVLWVRAYKRFSNVTLRTLADTRKIIYKQTL